jgi:hypothetical protein
MAEELSYVTRFVLLTLLAARLRLFRMLTPPLQHDGSNVIPLRVKVPPAGQRVPGRRRGDTVHAPVADRFLRHRQRVVARVVMAPHSAPPLQGRRATISLCSDNRDVLGRITERRDAGPHRINNQAVVQNCEDPVVVGVGRAEG